MGYDKRWDDIEGGMIEVMIKDGMIEGGMIEMMDRIKLRRWDDKM